MASRSRYRDAHAHDEDAAIVGAEPDNAVAGVAAHSHAAEQARASEGRQAEDDGVAVHIVCYHLARTESEAELAARLESNGYDRRCVRPPAYHWEARCRVSQLHLAVAATRSQPQPIFGRIQRTHPGALHTAWASQVQVQVQVSQRGASAWVQHPQCSVPARGEPAAVGRHGERAHRTLEAAHLDKLLAALQIPDTHGVVAARRGDPRPIRRSSHSMHVPRVAAKLTHARAVATSRGCS